jgi:hypothetical protein
MSDSNTIKYEDIKFISPFKNLEYDTYDGGYTPKSLLELNIMKISSTIRRKKDWYKKIFSNKIANKWKKELEGQKIFHEEIITAKIIEYIIEELRYYAKNINKNVVVSPVDGVYELNIKLNEELRDELDKELSKFEANEDWHPQLENLKFSGSKLNKQVLDLIHPSLYCYVNKKSHKQSLEKIKQNLNNYEVFQFTESEEYIFSDYDIVEKNNLNNNTKQSLNESTHTTSSSEYNINKNDKSKKVSYSYSENYQWLPCDIFVDNDCKTKILSYINNVHPIENNKIYELIGRIFPYFVPLFEKVLFDYLNTRKNRITIDGSDWYNNSNSKNRRSYAYYDDDSDDSDDYNYDKEPQIPITIDYFDGIKYENEKIVNIDLKNRQLQIIVKAANILLTPENPVYKGGSWHIEGMENESIVATGIYYYNNNNITDSSLHFRTFVHDVHRYEQNDFNGVSHVYDLVNPGYDMTNGTKKQNDLNRYSKSTHLNQDLGYIECNQDKCIAFPNIYQHCVYPFELKDKTKSGHRKILVFFLVDPTKYAISTKIVPFQRMDWILKTLSEVDFFKNMPKEIVEKICSYNNYMTSEDAIYYRKKLMEERKYFVDKNNEYVFEREVNLCEH